MIDAPLHPPALSYHRNERGRFGALARAMMVIVAVLLACAVRAKGEETDTAADSKPRPRVVPLLPSGHAGPVTSIVFGPGGDVAVTCSDEDAAILWDVATGEKRRLLEGHGGPISAAAFSPDGLDLVTGGRDGTITLWNAATGRFRRALSPGRTNSITALAFSDDNRRVIAGTSVGAILTWPVVAQAQEQQPVSLEPQRQAIAALAARPDGAIVSVTVEPIVTVWGVKDAAPGAIVLKPADGGKPGRRGLVTAALSADARLLVTGSRDPTATLWDLGSGQSKSTLAEHRDSVTATAISRDGTLVMTGSRDRTAILWDARTGEKRRVLTHADIVTAVAIDPRGRRLITGTRNGSIHFWDAATGEPGPRMPGRPANPITAVAVSADKRWLAAGSRDRSIAIWSGVTGALRFVCRDHGGKVNALAFSPDGRWLASASDDKSAMLWELENGKRQQNFSDPRGGAVTAVAFSPDSRRLATGSVDRSAVIWDVDTGQPIREFNGQPSEVTVVVFSPDGLELLAGMRSGEVALWNSLSGRPLAPLTNASHTSVLAARFVADRPTAVTIHGDRTAVHWLLPGLSKRAGAPARPDGPIVAAVLSPDALRAAGLGADGRVAIWETQTGDSRFPLNGQPGTFQSVCFSADGRKLFTGMTDGTARLWDLASGEELIRLHRVGQAVNWLATTPSGLFDGSPGGRMNGALQVEGAAKPIRMNDRAADCHQTGLLAKVLADEPLPAPEFPIAPSPLPRVRVVLEGEGGKTSRTPITVTVIAEDAGGGVTDLRLEHNGKQVIAPPALSRTEGGALRQDISVGLFDGLHQFVASARNGDGLEARSNRAVITFPE